MDSSFSSNRGWDNSNTPNNLARIGGMVKSLSARATSKGKEFHEGFYNDYEHYKEQKAEQDEANEKEFMECIKEQQEKNN